MAKVPVIIHGGLVDLQVNGLVGVDFASPSLTLEDVRRASAALYARGTIAFCATLVSSSLEVYRRNLPLLSEACELDLPARVLGLHLEGPFISQAEGARGAHSIEHLQKPDIALFDAWCELARGKVALVTLAPELPGACELIEHAKRAGAVVGIGHSMAGRSAISEAVAAGARFATHLGNGIPSRISRHDNPLWPLLAEDRLSGLFITDGHHLPADFIQVALRAKGAARFIVTSDATSPSGLQPGRYDALGQVVVLEANGRLHPEGSDYLAGSSASLLDCVNYLASLDLIAPEDIARVGRDNALELLGMDARAAESELSIEYHEGQFVARGASG
ncbi:MAG TPA: hypothetical protein VGJ84_18555 [Polyangiaceae bacterium]